MGDETSNILEQAATATQGMIPGIVQQQHQQGQSPVGFGPTPLVQPPPIPRFQPPQQGDRQTHFETVGSRKRADKQAAISGIANFVKAGSDYIAASKQRTLAMDLEKLMEAQQGMQEAQQTLQQNPNDPAAKAALETNTSIINTLTKDPKKAKLFQKALNIDLFGDGKNKKENMALVEAWKQFQQKQQAGDKTALNPTAQKMMMSQPVRQQLSQALKTQQMLIQAKVSPDANTQLNAETDKANAALRATVEREKMQNDLKIAEMSASKIGGEGTNVVDQDPNSITGIQRLQMSPDGKNVRATKNVVLPSVLPSEHDGISTLVVADPNSPTGQSIARIPNHSSNKKQIPGVGTVGQGGVVQRPGQAPQPKVNKNIMGVPTDGSTKDGHGDARKLGLPAGSVIISAKALSPAQVGKYKEGITAMEGTVERLRDIRQYTKIYQDMFSAGQIKLITDSRSGKRIFGSFAPITEDEKKATAAWQESAEYMNNFRSALNAQGFRSIPAYDNMLALRGQLWQDKDILNKTLDDSIAFMNKEITTKKKLLGEGPTKEELKNAEDKQNPAGLKF